MSWPAVVVTTEVSKRCRASYVRFVVTPFGSMIVSGSPPGVCSVIRVCWFSAFVVAVRAPLVSYVYFVNAATSVRGPLDDARRPFNHVYVHVPRRSAKVIHFRSFRVTHTKNKIYRGLVRCQRYHPRGSVRFVFPSSGQEPCASGVCSALIGRRHH